MAAIPAEITHRQMDEVSLKLVEIMLGLICLSIGVENVDDLILDLEQALNMLTY